MTCFISSNTNATDPIMVAISPYSRPGNSAIRKYQYVPIARDLESDWCHDFRDLSYSFQYKCHRHDLGVDSIIFEAQELENKEINYVPLARDLESDCGVTISVTCRISSNTNDTGLILVPISPYLMSRNLKMMCVCII